jgi:hypothetical protein
MRPVAIRKLAPAVPIVAGAVEAGAATGAATTAATAGTGIGSALMQGAKKKIGQVGVKDAAQIAQDATDKHAERAQQAQQNNIQSSQNMADKAKEEAKVTKAWRFTGGKLHGLNAPQYAKFTNNLIENAKRVAVKPDFHYKERMGEAGDPNEHRYQGRQPFIHNGKQINVTPHQIASAFMDHLHTDKSFTDKNHHEDTVHSLENMFETDTPHHDPYWEERGGNNMRRNEHGNVLINTLSPQMIGNTTTGYKSKTATPFQTIFSKYTNRINPLNFATQNEVHDLPQVPNRPKGPSAQVQVRNAVFNNKHGVPNLSGKQFADRKHAEMFGNRNPIGPYGTKVPRPTGDGDDIFDQRLGWLSTWYHGTKQKDEHQDEPQQETGSTHRLSPDYNPNLVKPQQPEPQPQPLRTVDMNAKSTIDMLASGIYHIVTDEMGNQDLVQKGEPMDIAMRLLKNNDERRKIEDYFEEKDWGGEIDDTARDYYFTMGWPLTPFNRMSDRQVKLFSQMIFNYGTDGQPTVSSYWREPFQEAGHDYSSEILMGDGMEHIPDEAYDELIRYHQHFNDAVEALPGGPTPQKNGIGWKEHWDLIAPQPGDPPATHTHPHVTAQQKMEADYPHWGWSDDIEGSFQEHYGIEHENRQFTPQTDDESWRDSIETGEPMDIAMRLLKMPPQMNIRGSDYGKWGKNMSLGNLNRLLVPDPAKNLDKINHIGFQHQGGPKGGRSQRPYLTMNTDSKLNPETVRAIREAQFTVLPRQVEGKQQYMFKPKNSGYPNFTPVPNEIVPTQTERENILSNSQQHSQQQQQQRKQQELQQQELQQQELQQQELTEGQQRMNDARIAAGQPPIDWSTFGKASEPMSIAMQMLKGSVHLTHNEDLPHQFAQDITNLDHNHQIIPTETGSSINHIHPDMLRTIELMAQNYQENSEEEQEEPFVMPKLFV